MDWGPLILTFKLALVSTIILLVISTPIAWWLSSTKSKIKPVVQAVISLPLVLPPTVLGFYLLIALSPDSFIGGWFNTVFGLRLVFSFTGLIIGSVIYSLPFMIQPLQSGFEGVSPSLKEASAILGKSKLETLFRVLIPNSKKSILTGIILSFAHTIGEFGVVLMIGGNIPNKTKVVSIAIYEEVESLNYDLAHWYSGVLLLISFSVLLFVYISNYRSVLK